MTSPKQGPASIRKPIKPAPREQQHYISTISPWQGAASIPRKVKSVPGEQHNYISTMISSEKGNSTIRIPVDSALKKQQDYIATDAGGPKLATASAKPNEDHVTFTGHLKSAVKAPKLVKREGGSWTSTGELKSQRKADGKAVSGIGQNGQNLSDRSATHHYQNVPHGAVKGSLADHRKLCIAIGIIVGLILLAGAAVAIYFFFFAPSAWTSGTTSSNVTTSSTLWPILDENGLLAYEAICVPQFSKLSPPPDVDWKECLVGPPPREDSCNGNATCIFYAYLSLRNSSLYGWTLEDKTVNIPMKYEKDVVPIGEKNATQLLCRTTDKKLGLCNGSTCTGARVEDKRTWHEQSRWEDNCDRPNPCWQGKGFEKWTQRVNRTDCLKMDTAKCRGIFEDRAAVVWMQHLRCNSGKDRSRKTHCKGLPLKLWVCAKCNRTETSISVPKMCDKKGVLKAGSCAVICKLPDLPHRTTALLSDGAQCNKIPGIAYKMGYCYQGTCFHNFTMLNKANRHELDANGCRNKTLK